MSTTDTTPLIDAVKAKDIVECRRLIESEGADIHQKDRVGSTPIMWGSWREYVDIVELLLSKGANIHDKDDDYGYSPILEATVLGHVNMIAFLLSRGASLQDTAESGDTCFSLARNLRIYPHPYRKHGLLYRLHKWPTTMAILVMTELALYHQVETDSLKDLHHFLGIPDDEDGGSYALDSEEIYAPAYDKE